MKRSPLVASLFAFVLTAGVAALAPVGGGDFDLSWHTIDGGGGGSSIGGGFELAGTIGQHDAGPVMTGGKFTLLGGFWPGVGSAPGAPCPADLDGSGDVGVKDLLILLGVWGSCPPKGDCPGDLDGDGEVGVKDLLELLGNWGVCP
ncbi:MAG: hypothetical protein IID42_00930 [Planctomycetes bacterium]|nr:hypothetical protein [Planctomycetota bacterium]